MYPNLVSYQTFITRNLSFHWKPLLLLVVISFVLMTTAVDKNNYIESQIQLFIVSNSALQILPQSFWYNITFLGDGLILIPLLSFLCLINIQSLAAIFGGIPLALVISHVGKAFFAIPRPAAILDHDRFTIIGHSLTAHTSFPSGHTITIFTAMSAIIFVLLRKNKRSDSYFQFMLIAIILFISSITAISRVAVGAHWPADLLLGAAFGSIAGISGEYLARTYKGWWLWAKTKPIALGCFILFFCTLLMLLTVSGRLPDLLIVWIAMLVSGLVGSIIIIKTLIEKN